MLYIIFLFHYLLEKLKQLFKPRNCYKKKSKRDKEKADTFIPYTTHNKKPSWVKVVKANNYEIIKQRKELKNLIPKSIPKNIIWSMDLTSIKKEQVLGVIDNGSRALLTLKHLKIKSTINIIRAILNTIELYGKPKIIRSDNEFVFTSKLMKLVLYVLGIKQQTTNIASPWQNGRIERLFLTMKQSFQDIIFPTIIFVHIST